MDFACFDAAWDDDLPPLCIVSGIEFADCLCRSQLPVILIVMANPCQFIVVDTKVDANNRTGISTLEFAEPLMRNGKVADDGDGKDAAGANTNRFA